VKDEDPQILFLYNVESEVSQGEAADLVAIQETATVAAQLIEVLQSRDHRVLPIPVHDSIKKLRKSLELFSPETVFVFNYCDTFAGNNMEAIKITRLLDTLGFKHTGSTEDVITTCINKSRTKRKLIAHGVATPRYQVFSKMAGFFRYNFPAIVKPAAEDASVGITYDSVVTTQDDLLRRVDYLLCRYQQNALVEEYIQGRELAVSLWGNGTNVRTLPITEQDYSCIPDPLHRILSYDAKWNPASFEYNNIPARCPADLVPEDAARVADAAIRAYQAIGLRDFGRVDIRYRNGIPYVIDINEIPDLSPEEGFFNSARAAGYSHDEMVEQILQFALQREGWQWHRSTFKSVSPRLRTVRASSD
jgi:D-alanine-D-alanine ligase